MPATNTYRNRRQLCSIWQSHEWRTHTRPTVLARANHTCEWPAGCTATATIADHWPVPAIELLRQHGRQAALNPDTCRALCHHHSGKADGPRAHTKGGTPKQAANHNHPEVVFSLPVAQSSRVW